MIQQLISNMALFVAFLFFFTKFVPQNDDLIHRFRIRLSIGVLFGFFGITLMFFSVQLTDGMIVDYRQLAIVTAAAYGGWPASILAASLIAMGRVTLFDGWNASSGMAVVTALTSGTISGILVHYIKRYTLRWSALIMLVIAVVCAGMFALKGHDSLTVLPVYLPILIVGAVFVALFIHFLSGNARLQAEIVQSEHRLRRLQTLNETLVNASTLVGIFAVDPAGRFIVFNRGAEQMLGYDAEAMIGYGTPALLHDADEVAARESALIARLGRPLKPFEVFLTASEEGDQEWIYVRKDGSRILVNLIVNKLENDEEQFGYMAIATDITAKKKSEERLLEANRVLQELSTIDGLTGIRNRRAFNEQLERDWSNAVRHQQPLTLILFDIDCFKRYNDRYGHLKGDDCLKQVAEAAAEAINRKTDFIARYGGEEFAVLLPGTPPAHIERIAERVRLAVESLAIPHEDSLAHDTVTISIGCSTLTPSARVSSSELIAEADQALYRAKELGRNQVVAYQRA
jgi:diguanylate cyclase (GGDEF)-like protein/PAS domain S-box-containing protein